jgi:glyoxylate utilization-related uncharacterized protein
VAQGVIAALPNGTLHASVAISTLTSGMAIDFPVGAGAVYVSGGGINLSIGSAAQSLAAGQAAFVPASTAVHATATGAVTIYLLSFRSTADKAHEACQSGDLPPLPNVNQAETLFAATVKAGGRSHATKTGGVELLVGVDGAVQVHAGTLDVPETLTSGQCVTLLEGTPVQVVSASKTDSRYLAFFLAPNGASTSVDISNSP